ncbi:twin-arginine translocase subunit TatC [Thermanaerosceptrum fracticalcis]|uniref:Sec-independent protein translocase protein TatC n=1 Tax=Thermanaerosceptrum fracticalcis TaxID=1712410 RepID=A0A7G6E3X0_THEFR|nr:twin-arginine translocase subunit TatC [Thermanaerosceptrum fracticalcis]QNB46774.1 twin-arginine translocase subunit TatC [Thermanaerosceptrum fracticalcis]
MDKKMSVVEHLGELRYRLLFSLTAFLIGALLVYLNMDNVIRWLLAPLGGKTLHFTGPADGFFITIQIAVVGGIMLGLPVFVYQVLAFILPGCTPKERRVIFSSIPPAIILFFLGVLFGKQILFPFVLHFFIGIGEAYLNPMLLGSKYFSFLVLLTLAMGLLFQIPLVMVALSRLGVIKSCKLRATRMYGYISIFMAMGIIIPSPDLLTLAGVCLPVILLYESSIWFIYLMEKVKAKKEKINYA